MLSIKILFRNRQTQRIEFMTDSLPNYVSNQAGSINDQCKIKEVQYCSTSKFHWFQASLRVLV